RHRTKSAITSMTEPALAMLAGGVTMRPPSQHRWDGTDLLASRSCGAACSSLAHSDWQSLLPAEIRATRCLSKRYRPDGRGVRARRVSDRRPRFRAAAWRDEG